MVVRGENPLWWSACGCVCARMRTARAASIVASIMRRRLSSIRIAIDCMLARSRAPSGSAVKLGLAGTATSQI